MLDLDLKVAVACFAGQKLAIDLPWVATQEQLQKVQQLCRGLREYNDVCCLPVGMKAIRFEKAFGIAGQLKSSEYPLLAGPIGKYLMQGWALPISHSPRYQFCFMYQQGGGQSP